MYKMIFAALLIGASPAVAGDQPVSVVVSYADLDLATADGVRNFDRRITRAAQKACGAPARGLASFRMRDTCVASAVSSAASSRDVAIAAARQPQQLASAAQ